MIEGQKKNVKIVEKRTDAIVILSLEKHLITM